MCTRFRSTLMWNVRDFIFLASANEGGWLIILSPTVWSIFQPTVCGQFGQVLSSLPRRLIFPPSVYNYSSWVGKDADRADLSKQASAQEKIWIFIIAANHPPKSASSSSVYRPSGFPLNNWSLAFWRNNTRLIWTSAFQCFSPKRRPPP